MSEQRAMPQYEVRAFRAAVRLDGRNDGEGTPIWSLQIHRAGERNGPFGVANTACVADDPTVTTEYATLCALAHAASEASEEANG